jgi:hypothetical protein
VYVIWEDESFSFYSNILFTKSNDGGATFSNVTNLSKSRGLSWNAEIASSGDGNVFVVWEDNGPGLDLQLAKSRDRGQTFDNSTNMGTDEPDSHFPKIALGYNNTINLAWVGRGIAADEAETFYARGYDSGNFFDSAIDLSNSPQRTSHHVQIITSSSSNNTYAIWDDASDASLWEDFVSENNKIIFRASNY